MTAIRDALVGVRGALRTRWPTFAIASLAVAVLSVAVPPLLLSVVRKPVDFLTFNPWLRLLPEYVVSPEHDLATKLAKLWNLALFWFSADSAYGGTDWGFAIDVRDVARIVVTALLVGLYLALWRERRATAVCAVMPGVAAADRLPATAGRAGGFAGTLAAVLGVSTGPCSVVGCGAPVLPVVGLAFTGLTSTTLKLMSQVSVIATAAVVVLLVAATAHLAWRVGAARRPTTR